MDADRFDTLARELWGQQDRRRLLRRLTVLPVVGGLTAVLGPIEESLANRPGQNRRQQNQRQSGRNKQNRKRKRRGPKVGGETCVPLDQVCSVLSDVKCCGPLTCGMTAAGAALVTTCQIECKSTSECQEKLGMQDVACVEDRIACLQAEKCCRPLLCNNKSDCHGGVCCRGLTDQNRCCAKGQHCAPLGGCASG